jgi:hypothetical protein
MSVHHTLPPDLLARLSESQKGLLEHWWELPDRIITPTKVHRFRGGTYQSSLVYLQRLARDLGGYSKRIGHGKYQLLAVGEFEQPQSNYYARVVFGKEMTPLNTAERFATSDGIKSLISRFLESHGILEQAILDLLDLAKPIDGNTIAVLEAYKEGMAGWMEAFKVFHYHFDLLLRESKSARQDLQLMGDLASTQKLLESS